MKRIIVLLTAIFPVFVMAQERHSIQQNIQAEKTGVEELTIDIGVQDFYSQTGLMISAKTIQSMDEKKELLTEVKHVLSANKLFKTHVDVEDKVTITKSNNELYCFLHKKSGTKIYVRLK